MRAMFQASSSARQQRLCDLLLAMCRGSVGACKQLLEEGAFPPVLQQLRALVAGEATPGGGTAGGAQELSRAQRRSAAEVSDSSDLDSSDDEEDGAAAAAATIAGAAARPGSGSSRRSSRPGSGRSRRSNAAAAAAAAAAALEADVGSGTDDETPDEPPEGLSPTAARPFSAQVSGLSQTKGWSTGGSARAGTAPPARSPAASAARLDRAPPPPPPAAAAAAAAASKPAGGATSGDTAGFFNSQDTARMASRLLELLQCVAGQCPDLVGPLLASTATCAALLPLLQALMALPMPSLAQRLLRNDALSLLLRAAMSHGGPAALQQAGVTRLLAAAAAASLPSDPPPPPQPVKGSDVTGPWKLGDGYNVALQASRIAAAARADDVQMQLYETLGGAATADPRDDDESLLRLTAGRTLEDFETRETIFSLLLQCSALIAREAREARLASSLLDYFGEGGDTDGALGNSEAAPGDPRAGWTGDQVATLQLLSLSLLQVLAPHDPIPFLEPFPPSLRFPEGGGDAGGAAIWMLVEEQTARLDSGGLECDDPIERQLCATLLSKGLKLLAEPLIAAQLLQLDALPAIVELCFRPPAAPNVPVEEGMIPCEALMLLAAAVEASDAAAVALVSLGLVPRLLAMLTLPRATAGRALPMDAKSSITAQLLMHRMDVLLSLSTSNADPAYSCLQWDAVSAALWDAEALQSLMRLLPSLPPPLLPIGFALLAEWCRDERQMRELLTWKAPPGVLGPPERAPPADVHSPGAPLPPSSIGAGTMYMQPVVPGARPKHLRPDALLLLLRLWADNEKQQPNRHLVAAKPSADGVFAPPKRPAASSLSDPPNEGTYASEALPPWRARAEEAKGGACVKPAVANGVAHGADLQLKLFGVLARARARGLPLPVLPPYEASLLVAVEAASGQRTAMAWRQVAAGLQAEGLRPVAADLARLETQAAAGQRQVEAVWAQQAQLALGGGVAAGDEETMNMKQAVEQRNNAGLAATTAPHGKLSIEQRQRGRVLKAAMAGRSSRAALTPIELEGIAEAHRTVAHVESLERGPDGFTMVPKSLPPPQEESDGWLAAQHEAEAEEALAASKLQATTRGRNSRRDVAAMRPEQALDLLEYEQAMGEVHSQVEHKRRGGGGGGGGEVEGLGYSAGARRGAGEGLTEQEAEDEKMTVAYDAIARASCDRRAAEQAERKEAIRNGDEELAAVGLQAVTRGHQARRATADMAAAQAEAAGATQ